MAFQAPVVNVASVTTDMWPSIKSTLRLPLQVLSRPPGVPLKDVLPVPSRTAHTAVPPNPPINLPECLTVVRPSPVRFNSSGVTPPVVEKILVRSALLSANPYQLPRVRAAGFAPIRVQTMRSFSSLTNFDVLRKPPGFRSRRFDSGQSRNLAGGSSSQNLLAHMEQTANNNPTSATAQNAFYSALLRADMPAIVVERYQTGRYATNSACENTYQRALERLARADTGFAAAGARSPIRSNMTSEQLQSIGQAVAAQTKGGQIAGAKVGTTGTGDKASPLYVVVEESTGANIFKWVKFALYFCLSGYLALVVITLAVETSGILKKVGSSPANEAQPQNQTVKFSDVQGCDEAKEELQELVEFLKNPERFSTLGGRLPKGVLLTGPPGTGKTLLARAVAGEAGVPFFFASGSEFDEMYVGVGAKRIRELFNNARAKAPAIIFIDELDAIGSKRVDRDPAYVKQSLNQLLTELDGFSQDTGVIIIAATNLPTLLDKALTRPGRFDRNVVVPLPDVRGRLAILKHHMKNVQVAGDVDETVLARGTVGFSGADLENLINQAAVHASRNKATMVSMQDLEWSKDKIMMGAERRSAVIADKDKLMTAYHEAGHALVGFYTRNATPVYKVTIMPRGQALGLTHFLEEMDKVSMAKKELLAQIDVCMGGKVAEELVYGEDSVTTGCSSDLQNATRLAYHMITQAGMSPTLGNMDFASGYEQLSPALKSQIENEVRQTVESGRKRATDLLNTHRKDLETLAKALVEYETLSLDEMKKVLKGEKLSKLTSAKGTAIKLPELVLPPGLAGTGTAGTAGGHGGDSAVPPSGPNSDSTPPGGDAKL